MKFRYIFWVIRLQSLQKCFGRNFTSCASKNEGVCCDVQTHFGRPLPCKILQKKFWTHFVDFFFQKWSCSPLGSDAFWTFSACKVCSKKLWAQIHDLCVQKRSGLLLSSDAFWKFSPCQIDKTFWAHFLDLCVQKRSCLLWISEAFWTFSTCKVYRKKFWAECQHICVQKRSGLLWRSDASWTFSPCKVAEKVLGAFSWFLRPKTKLFAVEFRRILDVLCL